MRVNTYRVLKCSTCHKTSKIEKNVGNLRFGSPFYQCKECGSINYDKEIVEPALCSQELLKKLGRERGNNGRWLICFFGTVWTIIPISLVFNSLIYGFLALIPTAVVLLAILIKEYKTVDATVYNEQVKASLLRLTQDESYAGAIINLQGQPAKDSAWVQYKTAMKEEWDYPIEQEPANWIMIDDANPQKPHSSWKLCLSFGCVMILAALIAVVTGKETLYEKQETVAAVDINEVTGSNLPVTAQISNLIGPFTSYNNDNNRQFYLSLDEEGKMAVLYLHNDEMATYQPYIDWLYDENEEELEPITVSGYSVYIDNELRIITKELIAALFNKVLGLELYDEETVDDSLLGNYYLCSGTWEEPSPWKVSEFWIMCVAVGMIELIIAAVGYILRKKMR